MSTNALIEPSPLSGTVAAIPSKSMAHRMFILSALCSGITDVACHALSEDITATLRCLKALGAPAMATTTGLRMVPVTVGGTKRSPKLDVGESGSTLRFLLPVIAALGCDTTITGHGRLSKRPLAPLDEQLAQHGVTLSKAGAFPLTMTGKLTAGTFELPGNVSSQYTSGLLMAAPLLDGDVTVLVQEPVESRGYIDLTIQALDAFGVKVRQERVQADGQRFLKLTVARDEQLVSPGNCIVEGDWSNAAFWLAAGAMGQEPLTVSGLNAQSKQGDRAVMAALSLMGARMGRTTGLVGATRDSLRGRTIDVSGIPDLVPPLAAVASVAAGETRLANAARLRLKESDRLQTTSQAINALGGRAIVDNDDLVITGVEQLKGGTVDAANDHRIAMMAAICAAYAQGPTLIQGADCVAKSYPRFFEDFRSLGGIATAGED